ncbi:hypothetical protein E3U23_11110 [Erythrobacter litoralis]|uniref:hypothetical protein n=1 Tax=Erythrobacter litoralis TaxID=39960 RepID=UPI002435F157|nr:hypothetical protein [Erythrobacter litoralis]MDG6079737.1 hypothetical protein [Erythrobacter litoralis]
MTDVPCLFHHVSMVRHKLDSVNECARRGYNLRFTCDGCGHVVEANSSELMIELNARRVSLTLSTIEEKARCSECGHRGAAVVPCDINF